VPLAEVYSSISDDFRIAYIDETERSSVRVTPGHGGFEVGGIPVFPGPRNSEGWPSFERNGLRAATPDARFGDNIHGPTQRMGS